MARMKSEPVGTAICRGLGIPSEMVSCVRLVVKAGDVLRAEVDFYPQITEEGLAQIVAALEEQRTVIDVAMGREAGEYRYGQTF
jgi:molybdopterin synthase catalytic subunit